MKHKSYFAAIKPFGLRADLLYWEKCKGVTESEENL